MDVVAAGSGQIAAMFGKDLAAATIYSGSTPANTALAQSVAAGRFGTVAVCNDSAASLSVSNDGGATTTSLAPGLIGLFQPGKLPLQISSAVAGSAFRVLAAGGTYAGEQGASATAAVTLCKENGRQVPFEASADTDIDRGNALSAAIAMAGSGDTILLSKGIFAGDFVIPKATTKLTIAGQGLSTVLVPNANYLRGTAVLTGTYPGTQMQYHTVRDLTIRQSNGVTYRTNALMSSKVDLTPSEVAAGLSGYGAVYEIIFRCINVRFEWNRAAALIGGVYELINCMAYGNAPLDTEAIVYSTTLFTGLEAVNLWSSGNVYKVQNNPKWSTGHEVKIAANATAGVVNTFTRAGSPAPYAVNGDAVRLYMQTTSGLNGGDYSFRILDAAGHQIGLDIPIPRVYNNCWVPVILPWGDGNYAKTTVPVKLAIVKNNSTDRGQGIVSIYLNDFQIIKTNQVDNELWFFDGWDPALTVTTPMNASGQEGVDTAKQCGDLTKALWGGRWTDTHILMEAQRGGFIAREPYTIGIARCTSHEQVAYGSIQVVGCTAELRGRASICVEAYRLQSAITQFDLVNHQIYPDDGGQSLAEFYYMCASRGQINADAIGLSTQTLTYPQNAHPVKTAPFGSVNWDGVVPMSSDLGNHWSSSLPSYGRSRAYDAQVGAYRHIDKRFGAWVAESPQRLISPIMDLASNASPDGCYAIAVNGLSAYTITGGRIVYDGATNGSAHLVTFSIVHYDGPVVIVATTSPEDNKAVGDYTELTVITSAAANTVPKGKYLWLWLWAPNGGAVGTCHIELDVKIP